MNHPLSTIPRRRENKTHRHSEISGRLLKSVEAFSAHLVSFGISVKNKTAIRAFPRPRYYDDEFLNPACPFPKPAFLPAVQPEAGDDIIHMRKTSVVGECRF